MSDFFDPDYTRKYPLPGYIPSPSGAAKKDNVEEQEKSEAKQFFGRVELRITELRITVTVKDGQTDVEFEKVF